MLSIKVIVFLLLSQIFFISPYVQAKDVLEKKQLIVRADHNYPPYEFLDNKGDPQGFNIDLIKAVAEVMGLNIKISLGPWNEVRSQLEKGEGTGLGLSTVYGIIKQSGGNIWVYSEANKGTTFKIYLPCVDKKEGDKKDGYMAKETFRGSETILIIEDEEGVRESAAEMLKMQGYNVLKAGNGEEAISVCSGYKDDIHLVLLDVVIPGLRGPELFEKIKEIHQESAVLFMSGYTDNVIVHHGILKEGLEFIQKPFTLEDISKKIREVLDKKGKKIG